MQKTRLGISVGLLGAAIYLVGLFGGYVARVVRAGYTLLFESNGWLRRSAVKAVVLMVAFSALNAVLGLIPDCFSAIEEVVALGGGEFQLVLLNHLFSAVIQLVDVVKKVLFLVLGAKALRQSTVVIPAVDEFISSYM